MTDQLTITRPVWIDNPTSSLAHIHHTNRQAYCGQPLGFGTLTPAPAWRHRCATCHHITTH